MNIEAVQSFFEAVGGPLIVAILLWLAAKTRKLLRKIAELAAIMADVYDLKSIACATLCRLDAQDEATKQIFRAMEMGRVNGEAKAAIGAMETARNNTDEIVRQMSLKKERPEPIW